MTVGYPALVKVGVRERAAALFGLPPGFQDFVMSPSGYNIRLRAGELTKITNNGKSNADLLTEETNTTLAANQRGLVKLPVVLTPHRYSFLVTVNPAIYTHAMPIVSALVSKTELSELVVQINAFKQIDVASLPWLVELTAID